MTILSTTRPSEAPGLSNDKGFLERRRDEKKAENLARWAHENYTKCKNARISAERQWYQNIEMYLGNQWVTWGKKGTALEGKLMPIKAAPWRARPTINRIRPMIRTEIARLTSQKPNASVVPASSEDQDLFAAQAGEQVWESLYNRLKINRTIRFMTWWQTITGVGYIKTYWDQAKTDPFTKAKGDLVIEFVPTFNIFVPDLTIIDIDLQPYVIQATTMPVGEARRRWPDMKFEPSVVAQDEVINNARLHIDSKAKPDSCLVLEVWLRPGAHDDFPEGGMFCVIDNNVVEQTTEGYPYAHGQFPFTKFDHVPTGKYYSESVIVDVKELQKEYNRTRGQIIDAKNRMAKPQLAAVQGSVDPKKMTSEPGQIVLYKPGFAPPQPIPLQGLPSYVLQELDRILSDIEDLSAQHQVSKGNTPPGVTAATAISYLQEKDDTVLSHSFASMEEGCEKIAHQAISLCAQYWTTERLVKVVGTDGAFDALMLKGSDIANATDVRMEAGSALPVSKAARQAFIMDLMKMNFIDPNKGLELMEIGGVQKLYDQLRVDERQAQRENLRMRTMDPNEVRQYQQFTASVKQMQDQQQSIMQASQEQSSVIPPELQGDLMPQQPGQGGNLSLAGMDTSQLQIPGLETDPATGQQLAPPPMVPINTWDNHAVHIDVHNRFRKSQAFETLDDAIKQLFEEHVSLHAAALNQSAMAAPPDMGGMGVPPDMGGGPPQMGGGQPPLPGM